MNSAFARVCCIALPASLSGCTDVPASSSEEMSSRERMRASESVVGSACVPTARSIEEHVLRPYCATAFCHGGENPAAALDLSSTSIERGLSHVASSTCAGEVLVQPGSAEESFLYKKLMGTQRGDCGVTMPPTGELVPTSLRECVAEWISTLAVKQAPDAGCDVCTTGALNEPTTDAGSMIPVDAPVAMEPSSSGGAPAPTTGSVDVRCEEGQRLCASMCIDVRADPRNCGRCGAMCPTGACSNGVCVCAAGASSCGSACVNLQSDRANCGTCGRACLPGMACMAGRCRCLPKSVSYESGAAEYLSMSCATEGCHEASSARQGLDLTMAASHRELVRTEAEQCSDGRLLVDPGNPEGSYLVQKLLGTNLCSGTRMPRDGPPIAAASLTAITEWICAGAPNN